MPATVHTDVVAGQEVVYVDYQTQYHYPAVVAVVTDRDGVATDLDVVYRPGQTERRNGVQHSLDTWVGHTWHFKNESPYFKPEETAAEVAQAEEVATPAETATTSASESYSSRTW